MLRIAVTLLVVLTVASPLHEALAGPTVRPAVPVADRQAGAAATLAGALQETVDLPPAERALAVAATSLTLDHESGNVNTRLLDQSSRDIELSRRVMETTQVRDPLLRSAIVSRISTEWELNSLGLTNVKAPTIDTHSTPSTAAVATFATVGRIPTSGERSDLARLDTLPVATRPALTRLLDAFNEFETSARGVPAAEFPGESLGSVLTARETLVDSVVALRDSLALDAASTQVCTPVQVPPVLSIDLGSCDDTYTQDFFLLVDAGGNDTYLNNAGGNEVGAATCEFPPVSQGAAALIDLSGDDHYGSPDLARCTTNGAGDVGAGFLLDAGGNDAYYGSSAQFGASNGGGDNGAGFLLDTGGDDNFVGYENANGGAAAGTGLLIHGEGSATYAAGYNAVNGGGCFLGYGALIDLGGDDKYISHSGCGSNGGAGGLAPATGFLLDLSGDDTYEGRNGAGCLDASGFLFDASGNDTYGPLKTGGCHNGAGDADGVGFLIDAGGNDAFLTGNFSGNGGATGGGIGHLIDLGGDDAYFAGAWGTNGGAAGQGSSGLLLDVGGDDTYVATSHGANGGATGGSAGLLFDTAGNDSYTADANGANGGSDVADPGGGLLLDGGGNDSYYDHEGGNGQDQTVAPKGQTGAQLDLPG